MDIYHGRFNLKDGVAGAVEGFHAVNGRVRDIFFALYRDCPDATRRFGEERF